MKILITGGKGMLGRTLQNELSEYELQIADLPECDLTDRAAVDSFFAAASPDIVIHAAAMTAVDRCESEPELAERINVGGSENVARACRKLGARLIAISTDYVFDGRLDRPYDEYDTPCPQSVYGKTKLGGEEKIRALCPDAVIVRIAWLYGAGGPSFVHTMLKLATDPERELHVVNDQIGNPTGAIAVARHLKLFLARPELRGVFHLTCSGETSWYGFAAEIFRLAGKTPRLSPCTTAEFPRPAPRPANSALAKRRLLECGLPPMPPWQEVLAEFIASEFH